jgi:uncharacterized protein (DUF608 family)
MSEADSATWIPGLGTQRTFSGEALRELAFPLGGIGTGTVSLGGRGDLRDWEIFNRPAKGINLPYTFFAIWARPSGGRPIARVLERQYLPPFVDGAGLPPSRVYGLPRLQEAHFTGAYPFAHIRFHDDTLPVNVELEAWNPCIPHNAGDSGLPVAILRWHVRNPNGAPVEVCVAGSIFNAAGYDGQTALSGRSNPLWGANLNEWRDDGGVRGLYLAGGKQTNGSPGTGSMALATTWTGVTYRTHWERSKWWDDLQNFWDDYRDDGRLPDGPAATPSPDGYTDVGSLGLRATIPAGATVVLPLLLTWSFPNLTNYWNREPGVRGKRLGNEYTTRFPTAWDAAMYTTVNLDRLEVETKRFHDTLFESTVPAEVLDAASSQVSTIRTTTCLRTEDGAFHGFEGCNDHAGCCPMNCTHVWNYEQALAYLFPDLERSMRDTDYAANTRPSGEMAFRTLLPLAAQVLWDYHPAADGQMGTVMKLYREWLMCGDVAWIRRLWPEVRASIDFAWQKWDRDRDGVMEGEQHNTYDIEFYGPNTMTGALYLGALAAGAELAHIAGDEAAAASYRELLARGAERLDTLLFNGEFYVQQVPPIDEVDITQAAYVSHPALQPGDTELRYQYGPGCLADQLLGQWFAHVVGLGYLLPQGHVRSAIAAIFAHNWRRSLNNHESCQRTYALNDEPALLACTWPNGGRPRYPFPYADEAWTGMEYQVAAHLIYEGMVSEGLEVVRGVRSRHAGFNRNPWDEFECGHHYARAMSSWSLLLALSGFRYQASGDAFRFAPKVRQDDFRCFFTAHRGGGASGFTVTPVGWKHGGAKSGSDHSRSHRLQAHRSVRVRRVHPGHSAATSHATAIHAASILRRPSCSRQVSACACSGAKRLGIAGVLVGPQSCR